MGELLYALSKREGIAGNTKDIAYSQPIFRELIISRCGLLNKHIIGKSKKQQVEVKNNHRTMEDSEEKKSQLWKGSLSVILGGSGNSFKPQSYHPTTVWLIFHLFTCWIMELKYLKNVHRALNPSGTSQLRDIVCHTHRVLDSPGKAVRAINMKFTWDHTMQAGHLLGKA